MDDNFVKTFDKVAYEKAGEVVPKSALDSLVNQLQLVVVLILLLFREAFSVVVGWFVTPKPENVSGQLCLVTGAANGFGRSLALRFAKEGCRIAVVDIVDTESAVQEIKGFYGVDCRGFHCDVSNTESVAKLRSEIESSMGSVDILVNNAGLLLFEHFIHCSIGAMEKCIEVNLLAHFKMVQEFLPGMISRKRGRIVAISSSAAKASAPFLSVYTASKCGVEGFMNGLWDDLCLDDHEEFIKLSTVYPFMMNTRKELADVTDEIGNIVPRLSPSYVADVAVKRILSDHREVFISNLPFHGILPILPDRVAKYLKTTFVDTKKFHRNYKQKLVKT